jgi:hypothetical protein
MCVALRRSQFTHVLASDLAAGWITVEPFVSIRDVLDVLLPRGFTLPVVPTLNESVLDLVLGTRAKNEFQRGSECFVVGSSWPGFLLVLHRLWCEHLVVSSRSFSSCRAVRHCYFAGSGRTYCQLICLHFVRVFSFFLLLVYLHRDVSFMCAQYSFVVITCSVPNYSPRCPGLLAPSMWSYSL